MLGSWGIHPPRQPNQGHQGDASRTKKKWGRRAEAYLPDPVIIYNVVSDLSLFPGPHVRHGLPRVDRLAANGVLQASLDLDVSDDSGAHVIDASLAEVTGVESAVDQTKFRLWEDTAEALEERDADLTAREWSQ
jgi:hypothetical protein